MKHSNNVIKSSEVIGIKVLNTEREKLGEIEEIVIDKITGKVAYVVLSVGNFLGMSGKLFAVPWHALHYSSADSCFLLNISKERIKNLKGFDREYWPDTADKTFAKSLFEYETTA